MNIFNNNKVDLRLISKLTSKPKIFEKGSDTLWDDPYVSKQLLEIHLNEEYKSASKPHDIIKLESEFIINYTKMNNNTKLLELGCGPGLYTKEFAKTNASITGIDISENSLEYAMKTVNHEFKNVNFIKNNYLNLDYNSEFDVATLIFYDFCALNPEEQITFLTNVHNSLKDGGLFILDVMSENRWVKEFTEVSVYEDGFWSPKPYLEIFNSYLYCDQDEPITECLQYTLVDDDGNIRTIRVYHILFNLDEITKLFNMCGFKLEESYNNLQGEKLSTSSDTYAFVLRKI